MLPVADEVLDECMESTWLKRSNKLGVYFCSEYHTWGEKSILNKAYQMHGRLILEHKNKGMAWSLSLQK